MNMINIEHLSKSYGQSRGIEDISFSVDPGEIIGLIGPNGAGKSTLIRLLLSFIYPNSGEAQIDGIDCTREAKKIKEIVGYVPSEINFYEDMTVAELLRYSARFYKKDCGQRAAELAQLLELDLTKKMTALSYGNKKKVAIVQALQHQPKVLILDEPTGGLDPLIQNKFFALLEQEKEKGTTILFSSHILSEVQKVCDQIAIIREGKLLKLERMDALQESHFKQIELEFFDRPASFNVPNSSNHQIVGNHVTFLFSGNINDLIDSLHYETVKNISILDPSLDDIFLHYYERVEAK